MDLSPTEKELLLQQVGYSSATHEGQAVLISARLARLTVHCRIAPQDRDAARARWELGRRRVGILVELGIMDRDRLGRLLTRLELESAVLGEVEERLLQYDEARALRWDTRGREFLADDLR